MRAYLVSVLYKSYFPLIHNPEIGTEPLDGKADPQFADFFVCFTT